jgi:hypothetical protein
LREEFFNRRAKAENDALEEGGEEAEALQEKVLDGVEASIPAEVE